MMLSSLLVAFFSCKKDEKKTAADIPTPTKSAPAATIDKVVPAKPETVTASATLKATSGSKVAGTVQFVMSGESVVITAKLRGLTPGEHGIHVHEVGDCSAADGKSAGGHFNPAAVAHGGPESEHRHTGDLGNLVADKEGNVSWTYKVPSHFLSLTKGAANNILNRAIVVHGGVDDYTSQPSGNAGPRVGCGVIEKK